MTELGISGLSWMIICFVLGCLIVFPFGYKDIIKVWKYEKKQN